MDGLDYSSFLLSCSPPRFDVSLLSCLNIRPSASPSENCRVEVSSEKLEQAEENKEKDKEQDKEPEYEDGDDNDDDFDDTIDGSFQPELERESTERRNQRIKAWESSYNSEEVLSNSETRKVVFADESGLKLEEEIADEDSCPALSDCPRYDIFQSCLYESNFKLPLPRERFTSKLLSQNICLEKVTISSDSIFGVVWICSHCNGDKTVDVRCTYDDWESFSDQGAVYVGKGSLPMSMKVDFEIFEFELLLRSSLMSLGSGLIFAVVLKTKADGKEFWDNNGNKNYILKLI